MSYDEGVFDIDLFHKEWRERYDRDEDVSKLELFDWRLSKAGLTPEQINSVNGIISATCMHCRNSDKYCYCMRDD